MNHEHTLGEPAELAALYAAGALMHEERSLIETHLDGCTTCRTELQQLDSLVEALAGAAEPVTPDPRIRLELLQRALGQTPVPSTATPLRQSLDRISRQQGGGQGLTLRRAAEDDWEPASVAGVRTRILYVDRARNQFTALVRMDPGASYPAHVHDGPEECLVLEGELCVGDHTLGKGDYQRAEAGSLHGLQRTEKGCLLLVTSSLSDTFT